MFRALIVTVLCSLPAQAHILLNSPYGVVGPSGLSTSQAVNATAISSSYDFITNTACITYAFGTALVTNSLDTGFVVLSGSPTVTNCLNLVTGAWKAQTSDGQVIQTGTLPQSQLPAALAAYTGPAIALRDSADYFAMTTFLPGTQPNLWQAGDL
jgi:hypothetical protein